MFTKLDPTQLDSITGGVRPGPNGETCTDPRPRPGQSPRPRPGLPNPIGPLGGGPVGSSPI